MRRLEDHGLPVDMGFEGAAGRAGDDDRWIFFTERQRLLFVRKCIRLKEMFVLNFEETTKLAGSEERGAATVRGHACF
jgi:hypothetical protein